MGCILIAMPKYEDANRISDMIRRSGEAIETRPCQNGNEVLRTLSNQDVSAVICTKQLKDMGYEELSTYLPNNVYMILLTKDSGFVPFSSNIISLVMPFKTEDLLGTIRKVVPEVFERPKVVKRSAQDKILIEKAKMLLMDKENMTEPEAFRYIQKTSMDTGRTMLETAQMVLVMNSE
ncbi:MAG: ANTAR domain-containing protein [Lachnospiraceae bacterium]|nr:ANTAR domain-containing protein [Lachnospiraceae bacterium]